MHHMLSTRPQSIPKQSAAPPPCEARPRLAEHHPQVQYHTYRACRQGTAKPQCYHHSNLATPPACTAISSKCSLDTWHVKLYKHHPTLSPNPAVQHCTAYCQHNGPPTKPSCTALYCMLPVQSTTCNSCAALYCILPVQSTSCNSCHPRPTCLTRWITCNHCSKVTQESPLISGHSLPNFPTRRCQQQQRLNNPTQMALTVPCPCTAHAQLVKQLV